MPRRSKPDPLAAVIGDRIRQLREELDLTMEKLAYESEVSSKGHLSNLEKGLARPTVTTLAKIAERLEVELVDLVNVPETSDRARLIEVTRGLGRTSMKALLREAERLSKGRSSD